MKIDKDKDYVVRVTSNGHQCWSRAMPGGGCSSMNIQRNTVEEVGLFLASFVAIPGNMELVEVFELTQPLLTLRNPT
jgi:hypothetical protein